MFPVRPEAFPRVLPTETKFEIGTSQSKSGTSVNLSNSGDLAREGGFDIARDLVHQAPTYLTNSVVVLTNSVVVLTNSVIMLTN